MASFGEDVRSFRRTAGLSLRQLAHRAHVDPGYLSRIEAGARTPSPDLAEALDRALCANGALAALATRQRARGEDARRESAHLSRLLTEAPGDLPERLNADAGRLAVAYLGQPAAAMLDQAHVARGAAVRALKSRRTLRPGDLADVMLAAGHLSGVLAYAALDLGNPTTALAHADAAWDAAEALNDDPLRAWTRGTQSLIMRFAGAYPDALAYALDGLRHADSGTAAVRLWCGVAQCHANLGDVPQAHRALAAAAKASEHVHGTDRYGGLFTFSEAKRAYYSGSAGIWLPAPSDLRLARAEAQRAIELWAAGDPADRSLDDEALARVYAATASVQLGELDAATDALEPILSLPPERRISWIVKRLDRISGMLAGPPYDKDQVAQGLLERIREYW